MSEETEKRLYTQLVDSARRLAAYKQRLDQIRELAEEVSSFSQDPSWKKAFTGIAELAKVEE